MLTFRAGQCRISKSEHTDTIQNKSEIRQTLLILWKICKSSFTKETIYFVFWTKHKEMWGLCLTSFCLRNSKSFNIFLKETLKVRMVESGCLPVFSMISSLRCRMRRYSCLWSFSKGNEVFSCNALNIFLSLRILKSPFWEEKEREKEKGGWGCVWGDFQVSLDCRDCFTC